MTAHVYYKRKPGKKPIEPTTHETTRVTLLEKLRSEGINEPVLLLGTYPRLDVKILMSEVEWFWVEES